jgi:outer membrane protein
VVRGVQIDQNIFDSGKTRNSVSQAESQVLGARATLRNTEQNVLLDAATSYMNVLRDTAILNLNRNNVEVLEEQLRQTRDRFQVGEVTRTDVAQAEARLSSSQSQAILAESNLKTSDCALSPECRRRAHASRRAARSRICCRSRCRLALNLALTGAPCHHRLAAWRRCRRACRSRSPRPISIRWSACAASLQQRYDVTQFGDNRSTASVVGTLTIPIYEGGQVYSRTRQAKETAGQRRIEVDTQRDTVRAAVVSAWGGLKRPRLRSSRPRPRSRRPKPRLAGVREEAKVGQRTTLDVLNAQQELVSPARPW